MAPVTNKKNQPYARTANETILNAVGFETREGQVTQAVNNLTERISLAQNRVATLSDRLTSVMVSREIPAEAEQIKGDTETCPLASAIYEQSRRLAEVLDTLNRLIDNLEI